MRGDLRQRYVRCLLYQGQDLVRVRLDPLRAIIPALWPGPETARLAPLLNPFDRRRGANPEPLRRRSKEVWSCRLASFTSLHLESEIYRLGNPL
jgi:hypothetical protein